LASTRRWASYFLDNPSAILTHTPDAEIADQLYVRSNAVGTYPTAVLTHYVLDDSDLTLGMEPVRGEAPDAGASPIRSSSVPSHDIRNFFDPVADSVARSSCLILYPVPTVFHLAGDVAADHSAGGISTTGCE
jgi:hypothetical protein